MSDRDAAGSPPENLSLPDPPNLEWLRKKAKSRLAELRVGNAGATLADAQRELARQYGFPSWRALKSHVDERSIDGKLFKAAESGDTAELARLLDAHPNRLLARNRPYEHTLLHVAAFAGRLDAVDLVLSRGIDPNVREKGDNTYPMHWAAAAGHLDVVRRLADAGGDVVGSGDDHALEVIGWASCFGHHHTVADFLVSRGARHHIFSAIALDLQDEVRRIVHANPPALASRMSRNENHQTPLHFAVRERLAGMVELLLKLGADPLAVDGAGFEAVAYADSREVDRSIMEAIRRLTAAELLSAERGSRRANVGMRDLTAALALADWDAAERLVRDVPTLLSGNSGLLHLMSKRNEAQAVRWLLDHGADPNTRWAHWDADVAPLHLAVLGGHPEIVRLLLAAGADPGIRDSKHDSDARGWAQFFLNNSRDRQDERQEVARLLPDDVIDRVTSEHEPDADAQISKNAAPLFEAPFIDPEGLDRDWIVAPGMKVRRRGVLSFAPGGRGFYMGITRRSDFADFALTLDVRIVRSAVGLALRATARDKYYMIQFDLANDASVVWFHTFTPASPRGYRLQRVRSPHAPLAGAWHRMRVVIRGYRFDVFLGDMGGPLRFCASWEDRERTYAQGAIGVWEAGGESGEYRALRMDPLTVASDAP
jgi:ankyrin repeat protein